MYCEDSWTLWKQVFLNYSDILLMYRKHQNVSSSQKTQHMHSVAVPAHTYSFSIKLSLRTKVVESHLLFLKLLTICRDNSGLSYHFFICVMYLKLLGWYFFFFPEWAQHLHYFEENLYVYVQVTKCVHVCLTVICKGPRDSGMEQFARALATP